MTLTLGTGPFGPWAAGTFNADMPPTEGLIYFEDFPRRMRASLAGETVVDSRHAKLLHEHRHLPVLYFPESEVRTDLLERSERSTHCPWKGDATYWSVRVGDRVAEHAAWSYPDPLEGAPPLAGHFAFHWERLDEWLEEDEPIHVHVRDPYHRVDVLDSSRHIRVSLDGELLADTRRPRVVFETGLPPRWYIPQEDVRTDLLADSDTHSGCAYKGTASYKSLPTAGEDGEDIVWYYPEPTREAARLRDLLCFWNERVDIEVDGEPEGRPETHWYGRRSEEATGPRGLAGV
jgi:uncharacterized protein (DUF427 family)